jgi:hypothetical protein
LTFWRAGAGVRQYLEGRLAMKLVVKLQSFIGKDVFMNLFQRGTGFFSSKPE